MNLNNVNFSCRHIGITPNQQKQMLVSLGCQTIEELINQTIPTNIRLKEDIILSEALSEADLLNHLNNLAQQNIVAQNYIGLGYHASITPAVILRNIFENPGWYTAYTPYQAEIAQGRLEALLNFQTMVIELTGMPLANASLLDEATAAAEAMVMLYTNRDRSKQEANKLFIADTVLPQTIAVLQTKAKAFDIELVIAPLQDFAPTMAYFGILLQYPATTGQIEDYTALVQQCKTLNIQTIVAADLLSLCMLTPPGEWGADVVVGTTQRMGIPLGYGGPHAAYFATTETYKRAIPGRIIGVSKDKKGNKAYRMALQTREQHIKREKATSNICTAQVLLAIMAGMYAVYHGAEGLKQIAQDIHHKAQTLASTLPNNLKVVHNTYFDTLLIETIHAETIVSDLAKKYINLRLVNSTQISISINEATSWHDLENLIRALGGTFVLKDYATQFPKELGRKSSFLQEDVFQKYHSETEMMRYIKYLERKDLSLNHSMISLGSCTMKLNAASEMLPLSWMNWNQIHPFQPLNQVQGYQQMIKELEQDLASITGFSATSLQPNSGAQGEYTGLMVIKKYFESKGETHRNIVLIPSSAHGTNPASATMSGLKVKVVNTLDNGDIDLKDLEQKIIENQENLCALMLTYPSTHGVFEDTVLTITQLIHQYGGQVYMDGANMNAQVGYTHPAKIGADVCHLNLHKTFAIPHGGGGPGVGPICVAPHLAKFLPSNPILKVGGTQALKAVSAAPYGSALVLLISYAYIKMLGASGLKSATAHAILNANYLKSKLEKVYNVLYTASNGRVAHEMIIDFRPYKTIGIEVIDIAKRLMDYGYHAPTVSFPVAGTLMIEPTESENLDELNRFAEALIQIKKELDAIAQGAIKVEDSMLKNAPHTLTELTQPDWEYSYTRTEAAYPLNWVQHNKFWPSVKRIDEAFGDRNLVCSCAQVNE